MPNGTAYRLRRHTLNFDREGYAVAMKFQTKHKSKLYGFYHSYIDLLSHVVGGLSEKLDRVLELLEKVGITNPFNQLKHKRRMVYANDACTIMRGPPAART